MRTSIFAINSLDDSEPLASSLARSDEGLPSAIAFDLDRHEWPVMNVATWITRFRTKFQQASKSLGTCKATPVVIVLKKNMGVEARRELIEAGASVIDRTLPSNCDLKSLKELERMLEVEPLPESNPLQLNEAADPLAYNRLPPGRKSGDLQRLLNSEEKGEEPDGRSA